MHASHEFGGVQMVKGRRRKSAIDRYGPMRRKAGYVTPRRKLKDSTLPIAGGIAFGKIKSPTQRLRAQLLDRRFFPDVENPKPRRYPKRPFMWPAVEKNRQSLIKLFADSIK